MGISERESHNSRTTTSNAPTQERATPWPSVWSRGWVEGEGICEVLRSEPHREARGDPPVGGPLREPPRHRARQLQHLRELVLCPDQELEGIVLPPRDRRRPIEEREHRHGVEHRVGGAEAPPERVAEVRARRGSDERVRPPQIPHAALEQ